VVAALAGGGATRGVLVAHDPPIRDDGERQECKGALAGTTGHAHAHRQHTRTRGGEKNEKNFSLRAHAQKNIEDASPMQHDKRKKEEKTLRARPPQQAPSGPPPFLQA
jgi:hypothetical protein